MIRISKISKRLDREKIIILIDGWSSYESLYYLMREFIPNDFGYIQYGYPDKILCSDPLATRGGFQYFIEMIVEDLSNLNEKKKRSFYMYGQSLGGLFCMIVSDQIEIKKIMLIVPGCNLAESFWLGKRTQKIKNEMEKNHKITLRELKNYWETISPDFYFRNKSLNTEFSVVLSKKDVVIPISNGEKLIDLLKERNIKVNVSYTNLPHQLVMLKEGLSINRFKKWVSSINS